MKAYTSTIGFFADKIDTFSSGSLIVRIENPKRLIETTDLDFVVEQVKSGSHVVHQKKQNLFTIIQEGAYLSTLNTEELLPTKLYPIAFDKVMDKNGARFFIYDDMKKMVGNAELRINATPAKYDDNQKNRDVLEVMLDYRLPDQSFLERWNNHGLLSAIFPMGAERYADEVRSMYGISPDKNLWKNISPSSIRQSPPLTMSDMPRILAEKNVQKSYA